MAVPNSDLSKGFYFHSLQGKTDFQSYGSYHPAVDVHNLAYVYNPSSSVRTSLRYLAYMPQYIQDTSWIGARYRLYFTKSLPCSNLSAGGTWFKVTRADGQVYPVFIAEQGSRIRTESYSYVTGKWSDGPIAAMYYSFFTTRAYSTTTAGLSLRLAPDGIWNRDSKIRSWQERKWIGIACVAGGANGSRGSLYTSKGGGASGAFWLGAINISSGEWVLSTAGRNIEITKDGTRKVWVGCNGGSATVTASDTEVVTYRQSNGAGGGGATNAGGSQNIAPWTAETPDQEDIPFVRLRGGPSGSGAGGGGGSSVFASGGGGGTRGNLFTGGNWNHLAGQSGVGSGAGGGGGCYTLLPFTESGGGSGKNLELVIGY